MSFYEKVAWLESACIATVYIVYLFVVGERSSRAPLPEVEYVVPLIVAVVTAIVATVIVAIVVAIATRDEGLNDERDKLISLRGEHVGGLVLSVGMLAPLLMTVQEVPHFWIANTIVLAFVLSSVTSGLAKAVAYRRGF